MRLGNRSGGGSGRGREPGQARRRLAKRLESMGYPVNNGAYGIYGALGGNRGNRYDDTTVCWEAWASKRPDGTPRHLHVVSYDTMTDCARGCTATDDGDGILWVYSDEGKNAKGAAT